MLSPVSSKRMSRSDLTKLIKADAAANRSNAKGFAVVVSYRVAHWATGKALWIRLPLVILHRLLTEVLLGVEIPARVEAGPGLQVWHCTGLVVHADTKIGTDVILRHNTTIGALGDHDDGHAPTIGDRVSVGTGAIILGEITIGDDASIGAGAVVIHDVPAGATAVGNPARILDRSNTQKRS